MYLVTQPWSLRVIQNHSASMVCGKFLLVFHCNYVSILNRFWDIQRRIIYTSLFTIKIMASFNVIENNTIRQIAYYSIVTMVLPYTLSEIFNLE